MVDLGGERDLGRLERVVNGEAQGAAISKVITTNKQEEDTSRVRRVGLSLALYDITTHRTHDRRLPLEEVVADGAGRARARGIAPKVDEFLSRECDGRVAWSGRSLHRYGPTLLMRLRAMANDTL